MYKSLFFIFLSIVTFCPCAQSADKFHDNPVSVVQAIFNAAKTGNYAQLASLCDPSQKGDGDTKMLCSMNEQASEVKREFREQFKKGRVIGKAQITGDVARVKIKFGADGKQDEEFRLLRIEGKWYLISY